MATGGKRLQSTLLRATCLSGLLVAGPALAGDAPAGAAPQQEAQVVVRSAPAGAGGADNAVNGIGQILIRNGPGGATLNLCTGTLINPRTVLFAAHCVNSMPAAAYGQGAGAAPIAIGFAADNQAAARQWLGLDGGLAAGRLHRTNAGLSLYAVEQVWYDPRSLEAASGGFMAGDIALATLDTPAFDIPTWALLFSPLGGPTHATITGYGSVAAAADGGSQPAIEWRRRTAENMISVLASLDDRDKALYGAGNKLTNNLYMLSFTDPKPGYDPAAGKFDFGIFGDRALPREGGAVGGDSGGPLIVDQAYDRPVLAGVLSGVARSFADQQLQDYGTQSFYQPLHLYWDVIAANNSYVYAGNRAGDGNWEDPAHWVRLLDPNYLIDVGGTLVNALPGTPAQGISSGGAKFGQICFLAACTALNGESKSSAAALAERGPEELVFHPDNVSARPRDGVRARYFDITLAAPGSTRLGSAVTIDRMTVSGPTHLDIRSGGALRVLGEYNQLRGWTQVDGALASERDMLFASGLLSGSGTIRAPYVTMVGAAVAPGGLNRIGSLAVQGNLILSSASVLMIDSARGGADRLVVDGILSLSTSASDGGAILLNPVAGRPAPRHGDSLVVATATGGVQGTFATLQHGFRGVLRPELRYDGHAVTADFRAASLARFLKGRGATELAFATALDAMREPAYDRLSRLYGAIDLMDADALGQTLRGIAPTPVVDEALFLERQQSRVMLGAITDRLSSLATGETAGRLAIVGTPEALIGLSGSRRPEHVFLASLGASAGLQGKDRAGQTLPDGLSGFVTGGVSRRQSQAGGDRGPDAGQRAWNFGMGLEIAAADDLSVGTALGYSDGYSLPGGGRGQVHARMSQVAVYGSYRFAGAGYVGGNASAERSRGGIARQAQVADLATDLQGVTRSQRYNALVETGFGIRIADRLQLTPRAQFGYERYRSSGFREQGGDLALDVDTLELEHVDARLGAKLAGTVALGKGWAVTSRLQMDAVQQFSAGANQLQVRFANAGEAAIALPLASDEGRWTELSGGLAIARGHVELSVGGKVSLGRLGLRDDRAVADLAVRF